MGIKNVCTLLCFFLLSLSVSCESIFLQKHPNLPSTPINIDSNGRNEQPQAKNDRRDRCIELNCYCPTHGRNLPKILDPNEVGLKRLVVYLYQNSVTGDADIYVPNAQKQQQIPDIGYEHGDKLNKITTQRVYDLLENNPNVITRNIQTPITEDSDKNKSPVHIKVPDESDYDEFEPYSNRLTNDDENKPISLDNWYYPKPNTKRSQEQVHQHPARNIHNSSGKHINWPDQQDGDDKKQPYIPHHIVSPNSYDPYYLPETSNVDYEVKYWDNDNGIVPWKNKKVSSDISNNNWLPKPNRIKPKYNINNFNDVTFDSWFTNQIKSIQQSGHIYDINIMTLKKLIQKSLMENGMLVYHDGTLRDSAGNILHFANLKLRPVLIGEETSDYKHSSDSRRNYNTLGIPTNVPYLESILITHPHPFKVIGMIPLGTVYLPRNLVTSDSIQCDDGRCKKNLPFGTQNELEKELTQVLKKKHNIEPTNQFHSYVTSITTEPFNNVFNNYESIKSIKPLQNPHLHKPVCIDCITHTQQTWKRMQGVPNVRITKQNPELNRVEPSKILSEILRNSTRENEYSNNSYIDQTQDKNIDHSKELGSSKKLQDVVNISLESGQEFIRDISTISQFNDRNSVINNTFLEPNLQNETVKNDMEKGQTIAEKENDLVEKNKNIKHNSINPEKSNGSLNLNTNRLEAFMKTLSDIMQVKSEDDKQNKEDEKPRFRIIGGNPAVSSGIPLSVKGRSGFSNDPQNEHNSTITVTRNAIIRTMTG